MFFLIAGVQPKTVTLDGQPRRCPSCGLEQAVTKRVDHHLSIFFLPLVRVKKGSPFLQCQSCGSQSHESGEVWHGSQERRQGQNCPYCGKGLEPRFRFCPFCGKSI
ncbi:MAG: zinc ribbon domain-containing protein [Desulfobacterales bacterium]|nr:zinc ribbon domain-containing protein [Desulfobacterales bacterium]